MGFNIYLIEITVKLIKKIIAFCYGGCSSLDVIDKLSLLSCKTLSWNSTLFSGVMFIVMKSISCLMSYASYNSMPFILIWNAKVLSIFVDVIILQCEASNSNSFPSLSCFCAIGMCFSVCTHCLCKKWTFITLSSHIKVRLDCCLHINICFWNWRQGN